MTTKPKSSNILDMGLIDVEEEKQRVESNDISLIEKKNKNKEENKNLGALSKSIKE